MREQLEAIARRAGELALSNVLSSGVHTKGKADFVTDADLAVSDFLGRELPLFIPGSRVLSEEGGHEDGLTGKLFIIDPIDGTTNLMYRLNLSAVSIGYLEDGEIQLAAVYNPFTREMFSAQRGQGAFLNGEPIRVNHDADIASALLAFEAGPATLDTQQDFLMRMLRLHRACRGIRFTGSAALDLCYVACGRFSAAAFHYLYPWDYAAGWLILAEAGGTLTLLCGGRPTLMGRSQPLGASNGALHDAFLSAFA